MDVHGSTSGGPAVLLAPPDGGGGGAPARRPPRSPRGPWKLVFSDEFDAPGALDPTRWDHEIGCLRNHELQCFTSRPDNARAEGGMLVLEARREPYQGSSYTSASLTTRGRFEFRYGRVEARAKLPAGNGTWPAIWLVGCNIDQVRWPACGEIDIAEYVGFDPGVIHCAAHMQAYNHLTRNAQHARVPVETPWERFHVYALEWHPDRLDWCVDDQPVFSFENDGAGLATWPFDQEQFLMMALAIGGDWGGQKGVDDSLFPHRLLVDWVRIYQQG